MVQVIIELETAGAEQGNQRPSLKSAIAAGKSKSMKRHLWNKVVHQAWLGLKLVTNEWKYSYPARSCMRGNKNNASLSTPRARKLPRFSRSLVMSAAVAESVTLATGSSTFS